MGRPGNLAGAVRVAAATESRGCGTMVFMSDRIFTALDVTKAHTSSLDAFDSPGLGPIGVIDDGRVIFRRSLPATCAGARSAGARAAGGYRLRVRRRRLASARRVAAAKAKAIVIAAMGRGNVPPSMVDGIDRWIAGGKARRDHVTIGARSRGMYVRLRRRRTAARRARCDLRRSTSPAAGADRRHARSWRRPGRRRSCGKLMEGEGA